MIDVTKLPAYVEQKRLPLIRTAVIGAKSVGLMNLQTDVKGTAALNILDTTVSFGDGSVCGWEEAGKSELSQRNIETGAIKINQAFCDKTLLKTWAGYDVRVAAGQKNLPFEEDFVGGVVDGVKAKLEKLIWQGDKEGKDTELSAFNGLIKIIDAATGVTKITYAAAETAAAILAKVYASIPSACFEKGEVHIYMGSDMYRKYIQELVATNLYHFNPEEKGEAEYIMLPGTSVKVYGLPGLDGTGRVFASYADNFVYGTDLAGDEEKFELWYSQDNREFRLAIEFTAGVQVAQPAMIVSANKGE